MKKNGSIKNLGKDFWLFRISLVIHGFSSSALMLGISVWILKQTGSATALASVTVPSMIIGLFAIPMLAPFADRHGKRTLLVMGNVMSSIPLAYLIIQAALFELSTLELAIGFAIYTLFRSLCSASSAGVLPHVVGKEQLPKARAYTEGIDAVQQIISSLISASLAALFEIHVLLLINLVGILSSALMIAIMSNPMRIKTKKEGYSVRGWASDLAAGLSYLFNKKVILYVALIGAVYNFFMNPMFIIVETMIIRDLSISAVYIGYFGFSLSLGLLTAMLLFSKVYKPSYQPYWIGTTTAVIAFLLSLVALSQSFGFLVFSAFFIGVCVASLNIPLKMQIDACVEQSVRSRVITAYDTLLGLSTPAGVAMAAIMLDVYDSFQVMLVLALAGLVVVPIYFFNSQIKEYLKQPVDSVEQWLINRS